MEQVTPESVRTVQDGDGLRSCCWRRVIPLESARLSIDSQPLRIPLASAVFDEVPQPPRDRGEGRRIGLASVIDAIFAGVCPADSAAARHRLPEVFVVGKPGESIPGALVHVVGQLDDVGTSVTHDADRSMSYEGRRTD